MIGVASRVAVADHEIDIGGLRSTDVDDKTLSVETTTPVFNADGDQVASEVVRARIPDDDTGVRVDAHSGRRNDQEVGEGLFDDRCEADGSIYSII